MPETKAKDARGKTSASPKADTASLAAKTLSRSADGKFAAHKGTPDVREVTDEAATEIAEDAPAEATTAPAEQQQADTSPV